MKSVRRLGIGMLMLLAVFSCSAPLVVLQDEDSAKGSLVLSVENGARTLAPQLNMEVGEYKLVLKSGSLEQTQSMASSGASTINLAPGEWALQVDAYNKDAVPVRIGTGTAAFTIQSGVSTAVAVNVVPLSGDGSLKVAALWTGMGLASPKVEATLTPLGSTSSTSKTFTVKGESAELSLSALAAGYYTLKVDLYDGTSRVHGGVEAVRIVAGQQTSGTFSFSGSVADGSVALTITVDLQMPMSVTISGLSSSVKLGSSVTVTAAADKAGVTWEWLLNGNKVGTSSSSLTLATGTGSGALGIGTYRLDAVASAGSVLSSAYKIFSVVNDVVPSTVSAAPGTSEFNTASLEVTLSAANPASGQYQIGTGAWVDFSSGAKVVLGASLNNGESVVLNLKNGDTAASYTYTKKVVSGLTIGYKASAAPTIWLWETTGAKRAIMTLENQVWPGPKMAAASDVEGYYTFTIPQSYLPVGDLAFKFNGGAEIALTAADIAAGKTWYDGTKWITKPAPQPQKPSIAMTPDSLYFDPSVAVIITVTDGALGGATTASYTLNGGSPVAITGGTATVNLTATSTIAVTATNLAGPATLTQTYTKGSAPAVTFSWDNASVYFVITDRFYNGNTANDNSYGRPKVDATGKNIGTFHGGDIAGLTQKLNDNYFTDLGVNALWITAPYEQAHGWVGGGSAGDFAHYAYHGYYALDFSNIDANMGTKEEFKTFVRTAHAKGVRVILDIVMNHTGYPTLADMKDFNFKPVQSGANLDWTPGSGQNWFGYHDAVIDYTNATEWGKWWGGWVRAGLPGYTAAGGDDLTKSLAYLPDLKTEDSTARGLPAFLANKATFGGAFSQYNVAAAKTQQKRVRDWTTEWLVQWVKEYGIDGFRVDTAKHVEMDSWIYLKNQSKQALTAWRQAEAAKPLAERDPAWNWTDDFWTTAEVWGHGPNESNYHTSGAFDSVINFGFQGTVGSMLGNAGSAVSTWGSYASSQNSSTSWASLSYISSHDTGSVFYNGQDQRQQQAGTALLLLPGGVQIYYGDELGRVNGNGGSDADQGSRSSVDWAKSGNAIHQHWQKVGQFRRNNIAVGAGTQAALTSSSGTAVSRTWTKNSTTNKVAIVMGASGTAEVQVGALWADGTVVRNAYTGAEAAVTGGKVSFAAGAVDGLILIEKK